MILTYCMRLYFGRDIMFDMNMFYMKTTALLDAIVVCYKRSVMCLVGSENRYGGFAAATATTEARKQNQLAALGLS